MSGITLSVPILRGRRGEEREKRIENVFDEITSEDFSSMKKETDTQVQEAQRVPDKMNPIEPPQDIA